MRERAAAASTRGESGRERGDLRSERRTSRFPRGTSGCTAQDPRSALMQLEKSGPRELQVPSPRLQVPRRASACPSHRSQVPSLASSSGSSANRLPSRDARVHQRRCRRPSRDGTHPSGDRRTLRRSRAYPSRDQRTPARNLRPHPRGIASPLSLDRRVRSERSLLADRASHSRWVSSSERVRGNVLRDDRACRHD